jgi:hypothetical protein
MIKAPFAGDLAVSSGYVFLIVPPAGLGEFSAVQVFDARNPGDIVPISLFRLDLWPADICAAGGLAYVGGMTTNNLARLGVLDVRVPARPVLLGTWTSEPEVPFLQSLQVSEGIAVLGMSRPISNGGPWILDCRNPAQIKLIDRRRGLRGDSNGIHFVGSRLFLVGGSGLSAYGLSRGLWLEVADFPDRLTWNNVPGVRLLSSPSVQGAAWEEVAVFPESGRVDIGVDSSAPTRFLQLVKP